jgi:hypothetical protein
MRGTSRMKAGSRSAGARGKTKGGQAAAGGRAGKAPSFGYALRKKSYALPAATLNSIQSIRQGTDCSTDTEVIKRAVALYDEVVRRGGMCLLEEADGTRFRYRP